MPAVASAFARLNKARAITIIPADLKNIPFHGLCAIFSEPKERRAKTGRVPSAKTNIVRAPCIKLPVVREYSCID